MNLKLLFLIDIYKNTKGIGMYCEVCSIYALSNRKYMLLLRSKFYPCDYVCGE